MAKRVALGLVVALAGWAIWSYAAGGLMHVLLSASTGASTLDTLREYVRGWGALAPLVYVAAVTVEVLVAPIPGLLLYAPAGAIFGGFVGGTLSLIGNTLGASLACFLARTFGEPWLSRRVHSPRLAAVRDRLSRQGAWVVFVLRLNPLTSSDLVSYAAGLAGVSPGRVALGTFVGMAPLCYLQAYLAQTIFEVLPLPVIILGAGAAMVILVWAMLFRVNPRTSEPRNPGTTNV